jgi:replication-associated recombination protein RarA
MRSTVEVKIISGKATYAMVLRRKITLLQGDSGTGKTTINRLLLQAETSSQAVRIQSPIAVVRASMRHWFEDVISPDEEVIFIDENMPFIKTEQFARAVMLSKSWFLIVSRDALPMLPYSYKEIYSLVRHGCTHTFQRVYDDHC